LAEQLKELEDEAQAAESEEENVETPAVEAVLDEALVAEADTPAEGDEPAKTA